MGLDYFRDFTPREVQRPRLKLSWNLLLKVINHFFYTSEMHLMTSTRFWLEQRIGFSAVVVHCFTRE